MKHNKEKHNKMRSAYNCKTDPKALLPVGRIQLKISQFIDTEDARMPDRRMDALVQHFCSSSGTHPLSQRQP